MDITLSQEDRSEILRYLGYRGSEITEVVEKALAEGIELSNKLIKVRSCYRFFKTTKSKEGIALTDSNLVLKGKSIEKHLDGAGQAILFCVTIGAEFDREVEKQMVVNPTLAVILNACGIQAVEKACDSLQKEAEEKYHVKTGIRFSPGYGDMPLSQQEDFIRVLNTERLAGVTLNPNYLMNPRKSVTAVAAVADIRT